MIRRLPKLRLALLLVPLALLAALATSASACQSSHPARKPIGEPFPKLTGQSLAGDPVELPPLSRPSVLLIGYAQDAQFDADRWLQGLLQAQLDARILELPTIPGLLARAAAGFIDAGMRSGIPSEDWASVVTVYGEKADPIARFTGSERTRNMRLLERCGCVREGYFRQDYFFEGRYLDSAVYSLLTPAARIRPSEALR